MGTKLKPGEYDCHDDAAPDEPRFTLLARDEQAPDRVEDWAFKRFERLAVEHQMVRLPERDQYAERLRVRKVLRKIAEALQCAKAMRAWKDEHA